MNEISNLTSNTTGQFQNRSNSAARQAAESETVNNQQVLQVASGEENDSADDRSQNAIQANVQGPSNELSAGLDREQLIEGLDNTLARQAVERSIENEANPAEEDAQISPTQAETAVASENNTTETLNTTQSVDNQNVAAAINQYNGAQQQVERQDIFFSRVENSGLDVRA